MKKGVFLSLLVVCLPGWSLDWELPVATLRYEIAEGESEDPDDETLQPASVRNTVTFQVRESADPATLWLTLRGSTKDYFLQSGDYTYLQAEHEGGFHLGEAWKLGYAVGVKDMSYAQPGADGLSNDTLYVNGSGTAAFTVVRGTTLEAGIGGRFALVEDPVSSVQTLRLSAGLSSHLGGWLLAARYHGDFRSPLGPLGATAAAAYATGSVSLQWDPND
jgi:hypothetical protein